MHAGGNRARAPRPAGAAGDGDAYRGQGAIINLSDDGSQSDDSARSAPAAGQSPPAAPHDVTDLTSPNPAGRLARSWSPPHRQPPLRCMRDSSRRGADAQYARSMSPLGHSDGHMDDMEMQFEHAISPFSPGNSNRHEDRQGLWDRSLSPLEQGGGTRRRASPRHSSDSPSPSDSPPFPRGCLSVQQTGAPGSDQRPQPRRRNLADLDGSAHAQPRTPGRDSAQPRGRGSGHGQPKGTSRKRRSKHPSIPLPGRGTHSDGAPRSPAHAVPGRGREALYQYDDRSGSDMSGVPEDDGEDSQDGGPPQEAAAQRHRHSASPEQGQQHMMTGAQRRRMRRLQEDQQLAEEDPEAWAHLQQTRAAMMPYGWDKCVPAGWTNCH